MAYSSGIISAPITVTSTGGDIGQALGVSSNDIGTLCAHANINAMSLAKPFCYDAEAFASASARLTARRSRNCGLTMVQYGNLTAVMNAGVAVAAGAYAWVYDRPRGNSYGEWFRTLDFDGYDHSAQAPWRYGVTPNPSYALDSPQVSDAGGASIADFGLTDLQGDGSNGRTTNYKYYDLHGLNLGVAIRESGTTGLPIARTFSDGDTFAPPSPLLTTDRLFDVVTFLTNQSSSTWTSSFGSGKYYLAPIPHSTWQYYATTGLNITSNLYPLYLTLTIKSMSTSHYYYKIVLLINGSEAWSETTPGTITSTGTTWTVNNRTGTPWTGNESFSIQYWTDSGHHVDQNIYPTYNPS